MLEAILFDMDGVLVDSMHFHNEADLILDNHREIMEYIVRQGHNR